MIEFLGICSDEKWIANNLRPSLAVMTSVSHAARDEKVKEAYVKFYQTAKPVFKKKYGFWQWRKVLVGLKPSDL